ncbi:MAG TPA: flagellar biosynthesis anti-sigma factor FlgM [Spongiibacteraceae bacterium]|jgi:negative regulator of flagellin synthesis FlgM
MATDIKGLGTPPPANQTALRGTGKEASTASERTAQQQPSTPPTAAKTAVESVNLSSQAQALKALEEKLQKLPAVNEKKVAEIKAALASGSYSVDDLVVAEKLLGFDELFK